MKKAITIFFIFSLVLLTLIGCREEKKMHESKERTPGNLAVIEPKSSPLEGGQPIIEMTEEIMYPNATSYEGARYEFIADETPARVAHWFEVNLEGCTVEQIKGAGSTTGKWIVTRRDLIIDVVAGPGEDNTLIRYKKDIYYDEKKK
ncbi:hypothetical protein KKB99_06940 [bacterium]|nr:hypothetical protein [bacterium]MBU1025726.1 hypothetical protein [bacterium]